MGYKNFKDFVGQTLSPVQPGLLKEKTPAQIHYAGVISCLRRLKANSIAGCNNTVTLRNCQRSSTALSNSRSKCCIGRDLHLRIARREDGIAFLEACERSESLKEKQPG
jgi:hypothetical protein